MFDSTVADELPPALAAAVAAIRDGFAAIAGYDLVGLSQGQLLALVRDVESQRRSAAVVDHSLIAELDDRHVAIELCQPNTAAVLRGLLRISAGEAKRRVKAAADLGPRRTLAGEPLAPLFGRVAAAQATGLISPEHARVIVKAVDDLPFAVQAENEARVEADLVDYAATFDPDQLHKLARRIGEVLDPDGTLSDDRDYDRRRDGSFIQRRDGRWVLQCEFTPESGAMWQTVLDSLARPVPADSTSGISQDVRSHGQRINDALTDVAKMLLRAGELPSGNGVPVTVLVTMSEEQLRTGAGYATTSHGDLIPARRILDMSGDMQTVGVVVDSTGGVLSYGRTKRLVPAAMRYALIARDQGCTFPGCDRPAPWCEAHHFREWSDGGETSIDNCGLVCGFHHREFGRRGWRGLIIDRVPHWVPPAWIDPEQKPRRNLLHAPVPCQV